MTAATSHPLPPALERATRLWRSGRHRRRATARLKRYLSRHRDDAAAHLHVGRLFLYSFWAQDGVQLVRRALRIDPGLRLDPATLVALTFAYRGGSHRAARALIQAHAGPRAPMMLLASAAAMRDERTRRNLIRHAVRLGAEHHPGSRQLLTVARTHSCGKRRRALSRLADAKDPALRVALTLLASDRCLSHTAQRILQAPQ